MKKKGINSLKLNKRSISSLKEIVKGGLRAPLESDCSSYGNGECDETYCNCETN
ncbi:hypothetical protein IMCC3317_16000 [Kordia antarctica]|uniref:Uncharacterized protein n=1 Tax=Kordia antarctica TaxID=1218801 RepID=A0A7L4ZIC1_9FLAO|nr:hypothetical protein [Kordia antarctica]QHI36241.1 hypothetical protein IMCC3317_16000 [Kordia antarctica]